MEKCSQSGWHIKKHVVNSKYTMWTLKEGDKMNRDKFRGLVYSKYKSMQEFSTAIGWQRNKTARIMNGVQEPNSEEMRTIAELFHLSSNEFIDIFFKNQFTKRTIKQKRMVRWMDKENHTRRKMLTNFILENWINIVVSVVTTILCRLLLGW